jgi:hypothetical protein
MTTTKALPYDWQTAYDAVPFHCEVYEYHDLQAGDWRHLVEIVCHPIQLTLIEEGDFYTKREARECVRWLKKFAPRHPFARL